MGIRARKLLKVVLSRAIRRRVIAIVASLAMLAVGFAHSTQHFVDIALPVMVHADASSPSGDGDASGGSSHSPAHCHGCSMIAIAVISQAEAIDRIAADIPRCRFEKQRPYEPVAVTPPPIVPT